MKKQTGFTLVELFVAVAILGILLVLVVPEMRMTILNNQITSKTNGLVRALNYARNESVVRGRGTSININAINGGNDWSAGWEVIVDNVVEKAFDFNDSITITASDDTGSVRYTGGKVGLESPLLFTICYQSDDFHILGRRIEIEYTGRINLRDRAYECGA